jgi:hypothetical protein
MNMKYLKKELFNLLCVREVSKNEYRLLNIIFSTDVNSGLFAQLNTSTVALVVHMSDTTINIY